MCVYVAHGSSTPVKIVPDMTYDVFGVTLNLAQSMVNSFKYCCTNTLFLLTNVQGSILMSHISCVLDLSL